MVVSKVREIENLILKVEKMTMNNSHMKIIKLNYIYYGYV